MAEKAPRKYGALASIRQPPAVESATEDSPPPTSASPTREKGHRPPGKRSDPAWKPYTLMLKTHTHTEAAIILKRLDNGQDMSDVAQELFEQWVHQHS